MASDQQLNNTTAESDDIVIAKCTAMLVLGVAAFVVTLLPVFISKKFTSSNKQVQNRRDKITDYVLTLLLSFGGGVLLCTTFLHLLPEVTESIEDLQDYGHIPRKFPLPLPELIMCCGFFTMYIVEEVVHKYLHSRQRKSDEISLKDDNGAPIISLTLSSVNLVDAELVGEEFDRVDVTFNPPCEHLSRSETLKIVADHSHNYGTSEHQHHDYDSHSHDHDGHSHHDHDDHSHHHHHEHDHSHHHNENHDHSHAVVTVEPPSIRELLIVLALTVHEGFEGLAIGLEVDVASVWYLLTAVAVHKCVIAFCIGVELVSGKTTTQLSLFYAFIYSSASPIGIAIGLILTSGNASSLTAILSVILQGMATGTLLYVVFFEILRKDGHTDGGLTQMMMVIVGFASMSGLTVLIAA